MQKNKLNFGCGKIIKSKKEGWLNVDIQKGEKIDKSFDFNVYPYPFKANTFDFILVDNVLEHLDNPQKVVDELWRISKSSGIIEIIVPHYKSKWAWEDITHTYYFSEESVKQLFIDKEYIYESSKNFEIVCVKLKASKPFHFFPKFFLNILSRYLTNIYSQIEIKVKVLK